MDLDLAHSTDKSVTSLSYRSIRGLLSHPEDEFLNKVTVATGTCSLVCYACVDAVEKGNGDMEHYVGQRAFGSVKILNEVGMEVSERWTVNKDLDQSNVRMELVLGKLLDA